MLMQIIHIQTDEQLQACLAIRQEVFVREQQVDPALEIDEYDRSPDSCHHVLLRGEDGPVAAGRMRPYDESTMKIQRIAVLKRYRGIGAGREMMKALEAKAKLLGYAEAVLDAQCSAVPFYEKLGYEIVSPEPFIDAGILHVRMKKRL